MSPAFRQAPENFSDQWPGSPLADTDSEDKFDEDDYVRAANAYELPSSSEDEDDPSERHVIRRQIEMELRRVTDYEVNYVNVGGYGRMPYGYTEDTSGFEQLHETPRALARRGVFTGYTRMVSYVNNKKRLLAAGEAVPSPPSHPAEDDGPIWSWGRAPNNWITYGRYSAKSTVYCARQCTPPEAAFSRRRRDFFSVLARCFHGRDLH